MFGSVVIDLVIAMALIFLVFSLVTSGLRELVAKLLQTRSKELWRELRSLLDDPVTSDLREIRALAAARDAAPPPKSTSLSALVETAADTLRRNPKGPMKARAWADHIGGVLKPVEDAVPPEDKEFSAAVKRTKQRLLRRQPGGNRHLLALFRAGRRGGERPLVPELPTSQNVAVLAAEIRHGTRTLADAINDHPFVRQIDHSWAGYRSKMQRLESGDFATALVDLVRAAGVGPALSAAFSNTLHELDDLFPETAAAEHFWPPIASGLRELSGKIMADTATRGDVEAAWASISGGIHQAAGEVGGLSGEAQQRLEGHLEAARQSLLEIFDNPVHLVRRGAEHVEESSPVKDVLLRLSTKLTDVQDDVGDRLGELRGSVEHWYDGRMSALSASYRKRSRLVAFGLALVVVIGFNVDAVELPQELWQNENVRTLVTAAATDAVLDLGDCVEGAESSGDKATTECVEGKVDDLVEIGLPLGWNVGTDCDGECDSLLERFNHALGIGGEGLRGAGAKVAGWLLAAAALSMGASFWFDILKRATGFKKSRTSPASDPSS